MSEIVSIRKYRKKKEKEKRAWKELDRKLEACERAAEEDDGTVESTIRMVAALGAMAHAMLDTPLGQQIAEEERKAEEDFKVRYQEVFDNAPDMPAARIKYFCRLMINLWRSVDAGGLKSESMEYDDFCRVYMDGVDQTISDWCRRDHKTKKMDEYVQLRYPFGLLKITKENMGRLLKETLEKILSIRPETGAAAKQNFLWELIRLFEIYRGVLYVFSDEIEKERKHEDHGPDGYMTEN